MRIDRRSLAALLLFTACSTTREPVLPPPHPAELAARPLTHADCEALALASAHDAAAFLARRLAAQAQLRQAKAWANPTLSASWENLGLGRAIAEQTLSLGMALDALFTRSSRIAAAEHDFAAERASLEHERQQLVLAVHTAYDELVAARERAALHHEQVALAQRVHAAAQRFAQAGTASAMLVDEAAADLAEAEGDRDAAIADAEQQAIAFAFALGFAQPVAIELAEPITAPVTAPPEPLTALAAATAARADLRAATERYRAEVERQHLVGMPRFLPSVGGGPRFTGSQTLWVTSLDVELPLFDQGGAEVDEQDAAILLAAAELRRTAQQVAADVALALADAAAARRQLTERAEPLVALRAQLAQRSERLFAAGELDYAAMLTAARATVQARLQAVDARLHAGSARLHVQAAVGVLGASGEASANGSDGPNAAGEPAAPNANASEPANGPPR